MSPCKNLPVIAIAGGSARVSQAGAREDSAPECLQPVARAPVAAVSTAAFASLHSCGFGVPTAPTTTAATRCCETSLTEWLIDVTPIDGLTFSPCFVAVALHAHRNSTTACDATSVLRCRFSSVAPVIPNVGATLAPSVQGALG